VGLPEHLMEPLRKGL